MPGGAAQVGWGDGTGREGDRMLLVVLLVLVRSSRGHCVAPGGLATSTAAGLKLGTRALGNQITRRGAHACLKANSCSVATS